jgi:hypothetical protein
MAQEHLPSKSEALSSNPSTGKKRERERKHSPESSTGRTDYAVTIP